MSNNRSKNKPDATTRPDTDVGTKKKTTFFNPGGDSSFKSDGSNHKPDGFSLKPDGPSNRPDGSDKDNLTKKKLDPADQPLKDTYDPDDSFTKKKNPVFGVGKDPTTQFGGPTYHDVGFGKNPTYDPDMFSKDQKPGFDKVAWELKQQQLKSGKSTGLQSADGTGDDLDLKPAADSTSFTSWKPTKTGSAPSYPDKSNWGPKMSGTDENAKFGAVGVGKYKPSASQTYNQHMPKHQVGYNTGDNDPTHLDHDAESAPSYVKKPSWEPSMSGTDENSHVGNIGINVYQPGYDTGTGPTHIAQWQPSGNMGDAEPAHVDHEPETAPSWVKPTWEPNMSGTDENAQADGVGVTGYQPGYGTGQGPTHVPKWQIGGNLGDADTVAVDHDPETAAGAPKKGFN